MTEAEEESAEETGSASPRYDFEIDLASDSTHAKVVRLVGRDKHVLELGCATGYMTRVLRDRGCVVVAAEIDPEMAQQAATYCERLIVGDIERLDLGEELQGERFDVIVAADVLEHLKDPLLLLRGLKRFLRPKGYVVASVPNVAHGSVRLALLRGRFPYSDLGLLDSTHLRFFTRETVEGLVEQAGYVFGQFERQPLNFQASEVPYDQSHVPAELMQELLSDPDAATYQYVFTAFPLPLEGLTFIQRRVQAALADRDRARDEAHALASAYERVQHQLAAVTREKDSHLEEVRALRSDYEAATDSHLEGVRALRSDYEAATDSHLEEVRALRSDYEAAQKELADQGDVRELTDNLHAAVTRNMELRTLLLEAHDRILRLEDENRRATSLGVELEGAKAGRASLEVELDGAKAGRASLEVELEGAKAGRASLEVELAAAKVRRATLEVELAAVRRELGVVYATRSWRLTALARALVSRYRAAGRRDPAARPDAPGPVT